MLKLYIKNTNNTSCVVQSLKLNERVVQETYQAL